MLGTARSSRSCDGAEATPGIAVEIFVEQDVVLKCGSGCIFE